MSLKIISRAAMGVALTAVLGGVVVAVQLYNDVDQATQAREIAIEQWLEANPNGREVISRYREACESGTSSLALHESADRALTFAECAAQAGSGSLVDVVQRANDSVTAPAPLRWL